MALSFKINAVVLQRPVRKLKDPPDNPISIEQLRLLENRRAGIEPIIGHSKKHWQKDRSRMKSDRTTESSGYALMFGFNIRQMVRYLNGDVMLVKQT